MFDEEDEFEREPRNRVFTETDFFNNLFSKYKATQQNKKISKPKGEVIGLLARKVMHGIALSEEELRQVLEDLFTDWRVGEINDKELLRRMYVIAHVADL